MHLINLHHQLNKLPCINVRVPTLLDIIDDFDWNLEVEVRGCGDERAEFSEKFNDVFAEAGLEFVLGLAGAALGYDEEGVEG